MSASNNVLVYDNLGSGHRLGYVRTLAKALNASGLVGPRQKYFKLLLTTPKLVMPTFEGGPKFNALIIALRALTGRKTVVIMLRAHLVEHRNLVNRIIHQFTLRFFGWSKSVLPLSIVESEDLAKRCPGVCFIADPEFWDLTEVEIDAAHSPLADEVSKLRRGRSILLVVGGLSSSKGLPYLRKILETCPSLDEHVLVVVAGRAVADAQEDVSALRVAGAFVRDRLLTDEELLSLFKLAEMAWCCYPVERDMSSGIFGRCRQIGVVPVVRQGSVLERKFGGNSYTCSIPYDDSVTAGTALCAPLTIRPTRQLAWASQSTRFRYVVQKHFDRG
jgi:hypothetical protein